MTFIGVHFNHPWITFFEKVTHTKVTFSYVFRSHSCDYIERLKYGLNITIHEYGRKKV